MKEVTVQELKKMMDAKEDFTLIDVREDYEAAIATLNGKLIPMGTVMENLAEFPTDKKVVVHCRSGKRSATVISLLEEAHGYKNLYNLKGGILAWADEIDTKMAKY